MHPDKPSSFQPSPLRKWLLISLLCLPTAIAVVEIARAILVGVIYAYGYRGNGRDLAFARGDPDAMSTLLWYVVMALFVPGGILVGLWVTRWDKYGG
jgi:amino acid transporter